MVSKPHSIHIPKRSVIRETLANGTTLLYAPNPENQIVAIRIGTHLASQHEPADKAGMANLCMRLLAAGTDHSTEEEISDRLEQNGAHYKAEAGKDWSPIDLLTTAEAVEQDLETILETIDCPTFAPDKIEREQDVVHMNILEQEDSHLTLTLRLFRQHYFGSHPYAWPSIGRLETIDQIEREDLVRFAHAAFDPSQLLVTVVGGTEDRVLPLLQKYFGQRTPRDAEPILSPPPVCSAITTDTEILEQRETEAEYIVLGYPGASIGQPEAMPLRIISAILGGSMDSRLFREIRDNRGLCYQIGSSYAPAHDHSPLLIYIVTSPQNRHEAVACAQAEVRRLQEELVGNEELDRVKTYVNGTFVMAMETNMGQASHYAAYEMAGLGWQFTNQFPEAIQAVTPEQIRETAQRLFTHRLLTITAPPDTDD
ncbi:MAG: pitrilysin family protein [bacterium]|jgi:predicted Zn-dependent peptidase|nr:pitrilysin family protein [bacterium]